jgi:hypothetical protein
VIEARDHSERGGPWAATDLEELHAIVSFDRAYFFDGQNARRISEDIETYFDRDTYDLSEAVMFYNNRHLFISVRMRVRGLGPSLICTSGLQWRTSNDQINVFAFFDAPQDNGEIYVGDQLGTVYEFSAAYSDSATATSKDYHADDPFMDIVVSELTVIYRSESTAAGQITIDFRVNQAAQSLGILFPLTGNLPSLHN